MPLLARKIDKPPLWVQASVPSEWRGENFPHIVLGELKGNPGVSFWEVRSASDRHLQRIAAALTIHRNNKLEPIVFRFIDVRQVDELQIQIRNSDGKTVDGTINTLHRELDLTGPKAVEIARVLARLNKS